MALICYNITGAPVILAAGNPPRTIPPSPAPPARGPGVNVTSELNGLAFPDYFALELQRFGTLVYEWSGDPEFVVVPLNVFGVVPGPHAPTHVTAGTDALSIDGYGLNQVWKETIIAPEAEGTLLGSIDQSDAGPVAVVIQPGHPRTLRVSFPAAWAGGDITVNGFDSAGGIISDLFVVPGALPATVGGSTAFSTVSNIENPGAGGAPINLATVETGPAFQLGANFYLPLSTFTKLSVDSVDEAFTFVDLSRHTWIPTTPPNGSRIYEVWAYQSFGHSHTIS